MVAVLAVPPAATTDVRTVATSGSSGVTSQGIVAPSATDVGDVLILATVNGNNTNAITGPTGGAGSGWTALLNGAVSDDLRMAVWVKYGAVAADLGATFTVSTAGSAIPMATALIRVPYCDLTGARGTSTKLASADSTLSVAPTALSGVLGTELALLVYGFSQNSQSSLTLTYASQPTWTQLGKPTTANTGTGNYNSGQVLLGKLGGGLSGDPSSQPTSSVTGTWAVVAAALKPSPQVGTLLPHSSL